ncbi:MAG: hypothetical protein J7L15_02260, partial [Clostridiales bacterium]|nr:hypothetical protein [Clostridiales bacterium]
MRERYTRETIKESLLHLFDTSIYKGSVRGARFKKFNIQAIYLDQDRTAQIVKLELKGTSWKTNSNAILVNFALEDKIEVIGGGYFIDLIQWFQDVALNINSSDYYDNTQFWLEYKNIKEKFPEYFL